MLWEELTAKHFEAAVKDCNGVCVLPIGVIEKHGDHLPVATDMITARAVCAAAAEREPAVVFPYYFFGQIAEARHYPGTVAASNRLLMDNLLAVCDEIARNGMKKILILSSHGGNDFFLPFFAQGLTELGRDYSVYTGSLNDARFLITEKIAKAAGTDDLGQHAGVAETALVMHIRPDLVHMEDQNPAECADLHRLDEIKRRSLFTGYNWYASFPNHFSGDPSKATPELGAMIFDALTESVAGHIRAVKADSVSEGLVREFKARAIKPEAGVKTLP
ncbi:MAG: creatininase family protein [Clostridiales bacterium]|jgi:creatinine amidohydrolase|nr:creatininase family protein [Clostridiales bacterium]